MAEEGNPLEAQLSAKEAAAAKFSEFAFGPEEEEAPVEEPVEEVEAEAADEEATDEVEEVKAEEESPDVVEVEYDGKLYEVPAELKDALLRQGDYTQKTQEVAAQRKQLDIQIQQAEHARKEYEFLDSIQEDIMKAQQLDATVNSYREYLRNNLDSLDNSDTMKIQLAIEDLQREREGLVGNLNQKQQEFQKAQQQSLEELLNKGTEVLKQRIPGWDDKAAKSLRDYAVSQGIPGELVDRVVDPSQIHMLWKAQQYDQLQANKPAAVKTVSKAPSIKEKSRNPMPDDVKRKLNLRKVLKSQNKSDRDKAKALGDSIADRFGF